MKMMPPGMFRCIIDMLDISEEMIQGEGLSPEQARELLNKALCLEFVIRGTNEVETTQ